MKRLILSAATVAAISFTFGFVNAALADEPPVVIVQSATSVTVDGVDYGKPVDAAVNNRSLAPHIQRALEAWASNHASEAAAAKQTLEAEKARILNALNSAKAKATTTAGKAMLDTLLLEAQKPEKEAKRAALQAEIAAKQAELQRLNN